MPSLAQSERLTWPDRLGIWTSAACVVHCLLTPVLLSLSAMLAHLLPSEEHTHRTLAVAVAALGAIALVRGYRQHGRISVLVQMACGLGCIAGAACFGDALPGRWTEIAITLCGSLLMIGAHRRNHTFCQECGCVDSPCAKP